MVVEIETEVSVLNLNICESAQALREKNRIIKGASVGSGYAFYCCARIPEEINTTGTFDQDQIIKFVKGQDIPASRLDFYRNTFRIFQRTQKDWKELKSTAKPSIKENQFVMNASSEYMREILNFARTTEGDEATYFSGLHGIWNLAHITLFEGKQGYPVIDALFNWMRLNFAESLFNDFTAVTNSAQPTAHEKFWEVVYTCAMRGFFDPSCQLLLCLQEFESECLPLTEAYFDLVRRYPKLENYSTISAFKDAWFKWNQDAIFARDNLEFNGAFGDHFQSIFSILAGNETDITEKSKSWPDAILAALLFQHPTYDFQGLIDLGGTFKSCFDQENLFDQIYLSLFEQDIGLTIKLCSQFDNWLITHLVGLMEKSSLLNEFIEQTTTEQLETTITEFYILQFVEYLLIDEKVWDLALGYLGTCEKMGKSLMALIIPRIFTKNEDRVNQLVSICDQHGLKETKENIYRVLGKKAADQRDYSNAILYYLEANDLCSISSVVERLLQQYIDTGDKSFEVVSASIPKESQFRSPWLSFLVRYHEFQQHYLDQRFADAANLAVLLLTSGLAPKMFWKTLLYDCLPLLEGPVCVFTVEQIMELMRFIENCRISSQVETFTHNTSNSIEIDNQDSFLLLKLALSRSLAAAIVMEK